MSGGIRQSAKTDWYWQRSETQECSIDDTDCPDTVSDKLAGLEIWGGRCNEEDAVLLYGRARKKFYFMGKENVFKKGREFEEVKKEMHQINTATGFIAELQRARYGLFSQDYRRYKEMLRASIEIRKREKEERMAFKEKEKIGIDENKVETYNKNVEEENGGSRNKIDGEGNKNNLVENYKLKARRREKSWFWETRSSCSGEYKNYERELKDKKDALEKTISEKGLILFRKDIFRDVHPDREKHICILPEDKGEDVDQGFASVSDVDEKLQVNRTVTFNNNQYSDKKSTGRDFLFVDAGGADAVGNKDSYALNHENIVETGNAVSLPGTDSGLEVDDDINAYKQFRDEYIKDEAVAILEKSEAKYGELRKKGTDAVKEEIKETVNKFEESVKNSFLAIFREDVFHEMNKIKERMSMQNINDNNSPNDRVNVELALDSIKVVNPDFNEKIPDTFTGYDNGPSLEGYNEVLERSIFKKGNKNDIEKNGTDESQFKILFMEYYGQYMIDYNAGLDALAEMRGQGSSAVAEPDESGNDDIIQKIDEPAGAPVSGGDQITGHAREAVAAGNQNTAHIQAAPAQAAHASPPPPPGGDNKMYQPVDVKDLEGFSDSALKASVEKYGSLIGEYTTTTYEGYNNAFLYLFGEVNRRTDNFIRLLDREFLNNKNEMNQLMKLECSDSNQFWGDISKNVKEDLGMDDDNSFIKVDQIRENFSGNKMGSEEDYRNLVGNFVKTAKEINSRNKNK